MQSPVGAKCIAAVQPVLAFIRVCEVEVAIRKSFELLLVVYCLTFRGERMAAAAPLGA